MGRLLLVIGSIGLFCMVSIEAAVARGKPGQDVAKYRRPVDLLLDAAGKHLLIGCAGTGELEVYHTQTNERLCSIPLSESIDALTRLDGDFIAACSTKAHRTYILKWHNESLTLVATVKNSHSPVGLCWDSAEKRLFVSCLWSRRIDSIDLRDEMMRWTSGAADALPLATAAEPSSTVIERIPDGVWDLPIAPRILSLIQNQTLVVSDGFTREVLVMDTTDGRILAEHDFFGAAIRGLQVHDNQLVALHSMLNEYAKTGENEIHWGVLMANDVRLIQIDLLLREAGDRIYVGGRVNPLGVPGNGAAEPTGLAVHSPTNRVAVTVGGTDQVAIGRTDGYTYQYIPVGRFPTAAVWSGDGKTLYVVNQFDDSISIVDAVGMRVASVIEQGPIRAMTNVELGEQLFHSATLSHDRWLTCASCHTDGHTNGQLSDNFGDRNFGAPKRVPSLLGIKGTSPFTWLGHEPKLQGQIVSSIRKTMHSYRRLDNDEVENIEAFMESLPPVVSLSKARNIENDEQVGRGQLLFESKGCSECHAAPNYTSNDVYDVGIEDEKRKRLFNPPSLRGVSQRGPDFFHDNRANGLRGVFLDQRHRLQEPLQAQELADLLAFLNTL
jgi:YVTN family beta-propeller protein